MKKTLYILPLVVLLVLAFLFPYSCDDWLFGGSEGIEKLNNFFANYDGRYVSNLILVAITRIKLLQVFFVAGITFLIILLSSKSVNKKSKTIFLLAVFLLLSLPRTVFSQAIVWTTGFVNYGLSTFFVVLYLYINRHIFDKPAANKKIHILAIFIGFFGSLVMENITLYNIIFSMIILGLIYIQHKKISLLNISYFIGALLGAILMFSNGAYRTIADGGDFYRTVPSGLFGTIEHIFSNYFVLISKRWIMDNLIINIVLCLLLTYLVLKEKKKSMLLDISLIINIFYVFYSLIKVIGWGSPSIYSEGIYTMLYFVSIIAIIFITKPKSYKKILLYLLSSILIVGPLFLVSPVPSRCFLPTCVISILIILELFNSLVQNEKFFEKILIVLIIVVVGRWGSIYGNRYLVEKEMLQYIKQEQHNADVIKVPQLPYDNYVWIGYLGKGSPNDKYDYYYKDYHNIRTDIIFEQVPYNEWKQIKK